jgi:hypothetical protein
VNQDGRPYKGAYRADAPVYSADALRTVHDAFNITPHTAATRWAGERMDYGLALQGLFDQRDRDQLGDVSAATHTLAAETPGGYA